MDTQNFIGRKDELRYLRQVLEYSDLIVVHGMKAVGKSCLVRQFCKDLESRIIWVDLRNTTQPSHVLQSVALELFGELLTFDSLKDMLKTVELRIMDINMGLVIVFDNAEDAMSADTSKQIMDDFIHLSKMGSVKIIVTSTVNHELLAHFPNKALKPMVPIDAKELLLSNCYRLKNYPYTNKIVELCEGLPLAIIMTAAELDDGVLTPDDMLNLLSQSRLEVLSQMDYTIEERIGPVYEGFLERLSDSLREKLTILNYIPGTFDEKTSMGLLECSAQESQDILSESHQRHLVSYDTESRRYDIHGILRECLTEYLRIKDLPKIRLRFCKTFAAILAELEQASYTNQYCEAICRINMEQQNFRKLFSDVIYCQEDSYHVFVHLAATTISAGGILFTTMETYETGFKFFEACLKKTREFKSDCDESKVLTGYGRVITNIQAKYSLGEEKFRRALELKGYQPKRDYFLALLYQGLGWNLGSQGRYVEGLTFLENALDTEERLGMYYENLILQTLQSLALFHLNTGDLYRGEAFQLETLKRRLHVIGTEEHPIIGSIMNNMGTMYERKGEMGKAVEYYKRGLDIKIRTKASVKAILISETNVANCLSATGDIQAALDIMKGSIERLDKFPGLFQDTKSLMFESIGRAHLQNDDPREASKAFEEALDLRRKSSWKDHSIMGLTCWYAKSLLLIGENEKTVEVLIEALKLKNSLIENVPTSPVIIESYEKILKAFYCLKRKARMIIMYNEGREELLRLINVFEKKRDFRNREMTLQHLQRYDKKYLACIAELEDEIDKQPFDLNNFLWAIFGLKILCFLLIVHMTRT